MFNFPYLTSLVRKNKQCRNLFLRTVQREENISQNEQTQCENERQDHSKHNHEMGGKGTEKQEVYKPLHWKKVVKLKFELEYQAGAGTMLQRNENEKRKFDLGWLRDLEFDSILRQKTTTTGTSTSFAAGEIQCKICDETYGSRKLLNQHKRLKHFPSWEGGNKEFCYVPYFVEPKRFNLLRGTLANGQSECGYCQKWLSGGVREKVGPYLENLRVEIVKEKAQAEKKNDVAGDTTSLHINKRGGKKRTRKCKSMARRVCELCSKILSNRKGLERHMLIHTGEKPFPCDICGKPFRRKDNCVRHKKTAHLFKKPRKPRRRKSVVIGDGVITSSTVTSCFSPAIPETINK